MTAPSLDRVRAAFEAVAGPGRQRGQWLSFTCPAHDDHRASAAIVHNEARQKTVVRCFAGCHDEDVLDRIGLKLSDLFDVEKRYDRPLTAAERNQRAGLEARRRAQAEQRRDAARKEIAERRVRREAERGAQLGDPKLVNTYRYDWADGTPAGRVLRYEIRYERLTEKDFRQSRWEPDRGRYVGGPVPPVLYRLPEVRAGIAAGRTVFVFEGEKDADRARADGLIATCNAMGAGSFTAEHAQQLAGARRVVIVTDRDEPGYRHAAAVCELVAPLVGSVVVVQAREGKDYFDHRENGHGWRELVEVNPVAEFAKRRGDRERRELGEEQARTLLTRAAAERRAPQSASKAAAAVTVYVRPGCSSCTATKQMLDAGAIAYEVVDLTKVPEAVEVVSRLGYGHPPVVVAGSQHWSGFRPDRIRALATGVGDGSEQPELPYEQRSESAGRSAVSGSRSTDRVQSVLRAQSGRPARAAVSRSAGRCTEQPLVPPASVSAPAVELER